jgi:hypothetical protein
VQIIAPVYQNDPHGWFGNYEQGEIGEIHAPPKNTGAAFGDDANSDGFVDMHVYTTTISGDSLIFTNPDGSVVKTIRLSGDTLQAHYVVSGIGQMLLHFGLVSNMLHSYSRDWSERWQSLQIGTSVGWQTSVGGMALVMPDINTPLNSNHASVRSPARNEQRERDDYNTYPLDHWLPFPYSSIAYYRNISAGDKQFDISLKLSASWMKKTFLPMIVK